MRVRNALAVFGVVGMLTSPSLCATEVFVRGTQGDLGHGHLRVSKGECYVITAKHLVADPGEARVVGFSGAGANSTVEERDSSDVAILKVSKPSFCHDVSNPSVEGVDHLLETENAGKIEMIEEDGSLVRLDVEITSVSRNQIDIESEQVLRKGISGSTLTIKGRAVGMIVRSEGKKAAALPMTFVETVWDRYVGKVPSCDDGCEVALKDLAVIAHKEESDTSVSGVVSRRIDYVYQLPAGWPTPQFFHVVKQATILNLPGMPGQPPSPKVAFFAFSKSATPFAQDVLVFAAAFDTVGQASASFSKDMQNWWIEVHGTSNLDDIVVSIKKPPSPWDSAP
jgi:hypothetical protein